MSAPTPAGEALTLRLGAGWDDRVAWDAWWERNLAYWGEVSERLSRLVPTQGVEFIASGYVLVVVYEDKSYAWLGSNKEDGGDGPWIDGVPNWVGGYRYRGGPDDCGEVYTECLMLEVPDPDDMDSVVETLARAARELGTREFTESA